MERLYTREMVGGSETAASATYAAYADDGRGPSIGDRLVALFDPVNVVRGGSLASFGLFFALVLPSDSRHHRIRTGRDRTVRHAAGSTPRPTVTGAVRPGPVRVTDRLLLPLLGPPTIGFLADRAGSPASCSPPPSCCSSPWERGPYTPPSTENGSAPPPASSKVSVQGSMRLWSRRCATCPGYERPPQRTV